MVDLDEKIRAWARSVHGAGCGSDARIEELEDHLYCEIERLREQGLSEERAFRAATEQLGGAEELAAEHARNTGGLSWACQLEGAISGPKGVLAQLPPRTAALLTIAISLLFAAAILLSSLLLGDAKSAQTVTYVLLALWWIPFTLLTAAGGRRSARAEYAWIRRRVARLLGRD